MRLAVVLDRFDPDRGGLESWTWQWVRWLLAHGHEIDVVAGEGRAELVRPGLRLHAIGLADSRLAFAGRVADYVTGLDVDLVHDLGVSWRYDLIQPHFGSRLADDRNMLRTRPLPGRVAARLSRRRRARLTDIAELEGRQYRGADGHVVAISRMTRDDLVHFHGIADARLSVVHDGIDSNWFTPASPEHRAALRGREGLGECISLLFVAHNFRLKGLDTALGALARLGSERLHLHVVGLGQVDKYGAIAARLGIADRVTFSGYISDMREVYAFADMLVHPAFYDPCSLTILEAAASGLPVITSRFNGAAELFRENESILVMRDPRSAQELAAMIERLLDPVVRARIGAAGLAAARAATDDASFAKLFTICERLLAEKRGAACAA